MAQFVTHIQPTLAAEQSMHHGLHHHPPAHHIHHHVPGHQSHQGHQGHQAHISGQVTPGSSAGSPHTPSHHHGVHHKSHQHASSSHHHHQQSPHRHTRPQHIELALQPAQPAEVNITIQRTKITFPTSFFFFF